MTDAQIAGLSVAQALAIPASTKAALTADRRSAINTVIDPTRKYSWVWSPFTFKWTWKISVTDTVVILRWS